MSKKEWEVGPVLKDKLNSQGTLFRGGTKYSSDRRYPKGYTPERQKEVADAVIRPTVKQVRSTDGPGYERRELRGIDSIDFGDRRVRLGSGSMSDDVPMGWQSNQPNRRLVDNIARSTVPIEHLSGVQFRTGVPAERLNGAIGHWDPAGDGLTKGGPVIRIGEGYESSSTPIHEIGHHVSHTIEKNVHERDEEGHSGPEEAWADDYAEQHHRDRRGRPEAQGTYGGGLFGGLKRTDTFWKSYSRNRSWGMSNQENARADEEYYQDYPEERHGDEPLITKEYVSREDNKKHGMIPSIAVNHEAVHDWSRYTW